MVATHSKMSPLGTKAHPFQLENTCDTEMVNFSSETEGKGFLIAFICNHCPFVIHLKDHFPLLFNEWVKTGLKIYAISANDSEKYPSDSPENMKNEAKQLKFDFPYLFDETQSVAHSYKAACTPDFFLYNEKKELFYRGQYDSSRPGGEIDVTGSDIKNAVNLLLSQGKPPENQIPSLGCNIKWK
jgi:peroxiredoxin|tara:strand:+ start:88 stop:642 length:555 start_codon:yes stop_codon:yes gene_type:complete